MSSPELERAAGLLHLAQRALVLERHGTTVDRAYRSRDRWERRWADAFEEVWTDPPGEVELEVLVQAAQADWKRVQKIRVRDVTHLFRRLRQRLRAVFHEDSSGAEAVYLSLASDTSEDAGQHTLDQLGINETWRWTSPRDVTRDVFAVRGSKVIQQSYGTHLDKLRDIIIRATDPAKPKSQSQIRKEIRDKWSSLTRSEVERIARTESASVWETTNLNAQRANGVEEFSWVVATGPSIGEPTSGPVCERCLERAVKGPYSGTDMPVPPEHPNCRCTLLPNLEAAWLPPAETWTGGPEPPLPLQPAL